MAVCGEDQDTAEVHTQSQPFLHHEQDFPNKRLVDNWIPLL